MTLFEALQNNAVFFYGVVAFLGLFVGSFLNVVIYRLPVMMQNEWQEAMEEMAAEEDKLKSQSTDTDNEQPTTTEHTASTKDAPLETTTDGTEEKEAFNLSVPRSRCPECNNLITWWQNIPVLSYLMLLGKCHKCNTRISVRYPLVELVTMMLSLVVAWQFGPSLQCVAGIIVTWFLVAMSMIDFDHHLLPDSMTLPLMWFGILISFVPIFVDLPTSVIGAMAGYMVLWLVYQAFKLLTKKEGMGFGDFKLLAALGALLGWQQLPLIILLSSLVGAVVGLSLMAFTGRDKNIPIPFGPYLASAGWIAMLWGDKILTTYYGGFS